MPPIKLNFDISAALVKLEDFVAAVRAASPQNIKLTASGVAANTASASAPVKAQKSPAATVATPASTKVKKPTVATPKKGSGATSTKGLAETKLPPITLNLDTSAATAALDEFIAKVKAASPQNIKLTASGNATSAKVRSILARLLVVQFRLLGNRRAELVISPLIVVPLFQVLLEAEVIGFSLVKKNHCNLLLLQVIIGKKPKN